MNKEKNDNPIENKDLLEEEKDGSIDITELFDEESENLEEIDSENTIESQQESDEEAELSKIEYRLQELEIILEQLEQKVIDNPEEENYITQYSEKKDEFDTLVKERKKLIKSIHSKDTSKLNQFSGWIFIYGIVTFLMSLPFISYQIWMDFATLVIDATSGLFSSLDRENFMYYIIIFIAIFSLPIILNIISWLIYINAVKRKEDKKLYVIFWIINGILHLGMVIYMSIILFGNM